jgi:hypothetical protein
MPRHKINLKKEKPEGCKDCLNYTPETYKYLRPCKFRIKLVHEIGFCTNRRI